MTTRIFGLITAVAACAQLGLCEVAAVDGKNIRVEFDNAMRSRVIAVIGGRDHVLGPFTPSETIQVSNAMVSDFSVVDHKREPVRDALGAGSRMVITGSAAFLKKAETVTVYDAFPRVAFVDVEYTNTGTGNLQ